MKIRVFPIISFKDKEKKFDDYWISGTAFLINEDGGFFTAGHNFFMKERGKDQQKLYVFALISNELIPVEEIRLEYDRNSDLILKDFAFGKITDNKLLPELLHFEDKDPFALGYKKEVLDCEILHVKETNGIKFYLYKLPIIVGTNTLQIGKSLVSIKYENVLYYKTNIPGDISGFSGGPVVHKNEILGVLVSHCFITSQYIEGIL